MLSVHYKVSRKMSESEESAMEPPDEVVNGQCFYTQESVVSSSIIVHIYVYGYAFVFCSVPDQKYLITDPDSERGKSRIPDSDQDPWKFNYLSGSGSYLWSTN